MHKHECKDCTYLGKKERTFDFYYCTTAKNHISEEHKAFYDDPCFVARLDDDNAIVSLDGQKQYGIFAEAEKKAKKLGII